MPNNTPFLRNLWYYALPGKQLKRNQTIAKVILGEPIVFGRTQTGKIFALRDLCPHRAVPLSCGRFDGTEIECRYHGWRFDEAGVCQAIPSLLDDQKLDLSKFRVKRYAVEEVQGNIWVYMSSLDQLDPPPPKTEIPIIPYFEGQTYQLVDSVRFKCDFDQAVMGLLDPAHALYVHRNWWWQGSQAPQAVTYRFVPSPLGFTMARHKIAQVPRITQLFVGKEPEDEITFQLPGVRIEKITTSKHQVCNMTVITPISETEAEITFVIYWTIPFVGLIKPFLQPLIKQFLNQDGYVLSQQQLALQYNPKMMLIKDADTQARWYYQLKAEFAEAIAAGRPFENPVKEAVLRLQC